MHQVKGFVGRLTVFSLGIILVVLILPTVSVWGNYPDTIIELPGTLFFSPGQPITVQTAVSDPEGILAVRCYFRYRQDGDFLFVEMQPDDNGVYKTTLPVPGESVQEIEYLFLAVDQQGQVVRTPAKTFVLRADANESDALLSQNTIVAHTDLPVVPTQLNQMSGSDYLQVTTAKPSERYGLTAGLYDSAMVNGEGEKPVEGYFGGFILQPDGNYQPIKGVMVLDDGISSKSKNVSENVPAVAAVADDSSDIIGPDIAGDDWEGLCYYGWGEATGNWYIWDPTPITATITQEGSTVTIITSVSCTINFENIGDFFQGSMDSAGNMLLVDQRNPVQVWSTHWVPATATEIKLGDYVSIPDPENNPYPDYYVIELWRDPAPPPPPTTFLPAIYKLLMPQKRMK